MRESMTFPRTRQGLRDLDGIDGSILPISGGAAPSPVNVGSSERLASSIGGGMLALYGLSRGTLAGLALAIAGGCLINRGMTGQCQLYRAMGVNTAGASETSDEFIYRTK